MLRGVSLAPQKRAVDPQDLPSELKNSLLGAPLYNASPYYGATGSRSARPSPASSPIVLDEQSHTTPKCRSGASTPLSYMTRMFGKTAHRCNTGSAGQVPVFDYSGRLTTDQVGVNTFRFRSLSLFYFFRSQRWRALITYSIALYLTIVLLISAVYYAWGLVCGAGMSAVSSIYFTVVSLAANGGYMGEDESTMTDPTHICYSGRTAIVMVCSYVNIVFVGIVAALVVGKAEYTGKLGHRIVFSDLCTITNIPGQVDRWRLVFRMAHADNKIPLAHGRLRLFCVTAEPLKEYHIRQQQRHLLRHLRPQKRPSGSTGRSTRFLPQGVELAGCGAWGHPQRLEASKTQAKEKRQTPNMTKQRSKKGHRSEERSALTHTSQNPRGRRSRHQRPETEGGGGGGGGDTSEANRTCAASEGHHNVSRSPSASSLDPDASPQSTPTTSSRSSTNGTAVFPSRTEHKASRSDHAQSLKEQRNVVADSVVSNQTISLASSQANSPSDAVSRDSGTRSKPHTTSPGKPLMFPTCTPDSPLSIPVGSHSLDEENASAMERVHISMQEMRWTCAGEKYLDHGESGELSLWYPANIIHVVDERSPLYPFLDQPHVAASLGSGGGYAEVPSWPAPRADHLTRQRFQIVAVFDATEMESGSTITAKHTYTADDILAHYKFSDRLVHMHPDSSKVILDFHYFNALMPANLNEPSTTDSDL
ncbi:hypothetical protein JKF63_06851 [Porcisia hertigi]|uniref:Inward rectifier potassium channel C-terminal domain-containing protein n=1 Tax=Porcisia hertigi TaxID=2761500 RepID=A0A837AY36_9TRYP|nr:hypothetical protein JKF63_06851 [Porcisia hertigi]